MGSGESVSAILGFEETFHPESEKEKCLGLQIRRLVEERQNIGKKHRGGQDISVSPAAYAPGNYQNLLTVAGGNVSEAARRGGWIRPSEKVAEMGII